MDALVVHLGVVEPVIPVLALGAAKPPDSPMVAGEQVRMRVVRDPRRLGAPHGLRQGILLARLHGLPAPRAAARLGGARLSGAAQRHVRGLQSESSARRQTSIKYRISIPRSGP